MLLACDRTRAPTSVGGSMGTRARGGALRRIGELDPSLGAPLEIVPRGGAALVVLRGGFATIDGGGVRAHPLDGLVDRRAVVTATGWCVGSLQVDARGEPGTSLRGAGLLDEPEARQLALRVAGDDWITAVALASRDRAPALVLMRRSSGDGPRWRFEQPGRAAAAFDEHGAFAVVTSDGRVRVLGDPGPGHDVPRSLVDVAIDPPGYAVAFDRHGLCVLVATRDDAHRDGGDRIAAPVDWQPTSAWSTDVLQMGRDGSLRSRTTVGFAALQSPVRMDDGALAVVGMGAARLVDGTVTWTRPATSRMHACAAADELVLGHGGVVERVGPSGDARSRDLLGREVVACAPAVGTDGRVWVATSRAVWRTG